MDETKKNTAPKASATPARKMKGVTRKTDVTLGWVERDYPQLAAWRVLAAKWIRGETQNVSNKLEALAAFFERYLIERGLPLDPVIFLARNTVLPDFYRTTFPDSKWGVEYNNVIHTFLHFVLQREFSESADDGQPVVSPAFRNPVPRLSKSGLPKRDESVHSPLPYGYIDELRQMLAAEPPLPRRRWGHKAPGGGNGPNA